MEMPDPNQTLRTFGLLRADQRQWQQEQADRGMRSALGGMQPGFTADDLLGRLQNVPGTGEAMLGVRAGQLEAKSKDQKRLQEIEDKREESYLDMLSDGQLEAARAFKNAYKIDFPDQLEEAAAKDRDFKALADVMKANKENVAYNGKLLSAYSQTGSASKAMEMAGAPPPTYAEQTGRMNAQAAMARANRPATASGGTSGTTPGSRAAEHVLDQWYNNFKDTKFRDPTSQEVVEKYNEIASGINVGSGAQPPVPEQPGAVPPPQPATQPAIQGMPGAGAGQTTPPSAPAPAAPAPAAPAPAGGGYPSFQDSATALTAGILNRGTPQPQPQASIQAAPGPQAFGQIPQQPGQAAAATSFGGAQAAPGGAKRVLIIPGMSPDQMLEQQGVRVGEAFLDPETGEERVRSR